MELHAHKAYCSNIPNAKKDYACYSPVTAALKECSSAALKYKDGAKCANQSHCVDTKSFMCLHFIKKTVSVGKYTCRPQSCLYMKHGSCKSGEWKWRNAKPANHTMNANQCMD